MRDEFSVYWWDKDGTQHEELRLVGAEEVVKAAKRLTEGALLHRPAGCAG